MGICNSTEVRNDNSEGTYYIFVSNDPQKVKDYSERPNTISCSPEESQLEDYKFHKFETLEDTPDSDTIYIVHPHEKSEYIPLDKYRDIVFKEKAKELSELMKRLGAKEIEYNFNAGREGRKEIGGEISVPEIGGVGISVQKSTSQTVAKSERTVFEHPDTTYVLRDTKHKPNSIIFDLDKITAGLKFYEHQDDWKKCVELRSKSWILELNVKTESRTSKEYANAAHIFALGGRIDANHTTARADEGMEEYKVNFFSEKHYLEEEIYNKMNEKEVDYTVTLGGKLKEGTIYAQDKSEEWVLCSVVVRERGLTLGFHSKGKEKENAVDDVIEFLSFEDVVIDVLPDNARRSRESKLYPFAVRSESNRVQKAKSKTSDFENGSVKVDAIRNEVILAVLNGKHMWEWASAIKWLGSKPIEEIIPSIRMPSLVSDHDEHYEEPNILQNVLLKMFTYKNLPNKPVTYDEIEWPSYYSSYYSSYDSSDDIHDGSDDSSYDSSDDIHDNCSDDSTHEKNKIRPNSPSDSIPLVENPESTFGKFAIIILVGACVQMNEKCFELINSSNLYDLSSEGGYKTMGNSIMSMLCEGDYSTSREYMVKSLFNQGYPKLVGYKAGCYASTSFTINLAKPSRNNFRISSPTGQPVHPDDQKLCRLLRDYGDGKEDNMQLSDQLIEASNQEATSFTSEHRIGITKIEISMKILSWGSSKLTTLNLNHNSIFELPDELFNFTNLTHLDLSQNCLFGLSHKVGSLVNLENFNVETNLITELPYSIAELEKITEFKCDQNPITKPPSAVWSKGIVDIRSFFKDMEGGTEINVDLRVLVLGLSEAGKTSLINGLIDPSTVSMTRVGDRTVGIEKRTWALDRPEKQQPVNLLVYDFAGQEEYYITHHLFLGNRALYILAFDLSKYEADVLDRQILLWWNSIQDRICNVKSQDSKTPKVIIVATKADLVKHAQDRADHIHGVLEKRFRLRLEGVKERLKLLDKKLRNLDPRRKGKLNDEADKKKRQQEYKALPDPTKIEILMKENEEKKMRHQLQCTIALPSKIHAISSKDLSNFDQFKEQISSSLTEVGPSGKYFPQVDEELPSSWFRVRKFIRDQSTRKGRECMKMPSYFKLLSDELGINEDVGRRATQFCHELGDVLFFEKEDLVFLSPSFLIDVFKLVIRHDHKESTYWKKEMMEDLRIDEKTFNFGKKLLLQGELEEWLLDVLWLQLDGVYSDSSIKNNLIQLLETFDIATSIEHEYNKKRLLIPEFQPKSISLTWQKNKEVGQFDAQRWICVNGNLPYGLLKRIQIRVIKTIFKKNGTNGFELAQNQFLIRDVNFTTLYCTSGQGSDECPGFGMSEGIRLYVRGTDKQRVLTLLTKVHGCVQDTLTDFPGLMFDHYAVYTSKNGGTSFITLGELKEKQTTGKTMISVSPKQCTPGSKLGEDLMTSLPEDIMIDDLIQAPETLDDTLFKALSVALIDRPMKAHPMSTTDQNLSDLNSMMDKQVIVPHDNRQQAMVSSSALFHIGDLSVDQNLDEKNKDQLASDTVHDRRREMASSTASSHKKRISVARNLGDKNESEQTLLELFEVLGIELEASKRMSTIFSKEGFTSSNDLLESLPGDIETLDYTLREEARSFRVKDKLNIVKWLKKNRSA